jgi:hypothetical protein
MLASFGLPPCNIIFSITPFNMKILLFTPTIEYVDLRFHINDDLIWQMRGVNDIIFTLYGIIKKKFIIAG